jgi:predicted acetyltransferase
VFHVGTHPCHRGRGETSALLAAVMARMRHGGELFALNAAPETIDLHRRLGFALCDTDAVWRWGTAE